MVSTSDSFQKGARGSSAWIAELSGREKDILRLVAAGLIDKHIANELDISLNTLRTYWSRIRKKSGHMTRVALVLAFVRWEAVSANSESRSLSATPLLSDMTDPDAFRRSAAYYAIAVQSVHDAIRKAYCLTRVLTTYPHSRIHSMGEMELTNYVCKALVDEGGYLMVWIGYMQDDDLKSVHCTASAGDSKHYLRQARISWGDNRYGYGPTGRAIRTGQAQINQDFQTNPQVAPWQELAAEHGFRSSMAVPLKVDSEIIGVLSAYASAPNSFQETEIRLLELIAADLAVRIIQIRTTSETPRTS